MELILSRPGVLRTFSTEWRAKWVPAIIAYCKGLKKRDIVEYITTHNSDENSGGFSKLHVCIYNDN